MISPSKTRSESVVLTSKLGVEYHMSYVGPTYGDLAGAWPKPTLFGGWWAIDCHRVYALWIKEGPL